MVEWRPGDSIRLCVWLAACSLPQTGNNTGFIFLGGIVNASDIIAGDKDPSNWVLRH